MINITFILVEPAVPENIGAAARAIKTMGFDQLRLVNPCQFHDGKARWVAHASTEILDRARVYTSLAEAVQDLDFVIGTSARAKSAKADHHPAESIQDLLQAKVQSLTNVGIVFGREESGLSNEELRLCDISTYIQMQTTHPSLNLAQAVMLYAYLLSEKTIAERPVNSLSPSEPKFAALKNQVSELLKNTKIAGNPNIYHRIFERLALLEDNDVNLVLSVIAALEEKYRSCG
ncbi:MAG: tRNA/rRNA methyltransferase [Bacteroidales bacterium]